LVFAGLLLLPAAEAVAACSGSGTTWSCTAGTTITEVNKAYQSGTDPVTITMAAGAYSWTAGGEYIILSNTKGLTLQCASPRACKVQHGAGYLLYMDTLSGDNRKTYRMTGFDIWGGTQSVVWFYAGSGSATMHNCRIDNNTIRDMDPVSAPVAIMLGGGGAGKFKCLIDNNTFSGTVNFAALKYLGPGNPDLYPSSVRGTADNVFLEDNIFNFATAGNLGLGCIDVWWAGSVVARYNDSTNCLWTAHGVSHNTTVNFEFYKNTLRRTRGSGDWAHGQRLFHHQGSGEMLVWGNTFASDEALSGAAMVLTHYRSASPADAGYAEATGRCNGTSSRDGNRSLGYPCWMQPGRAPAGGSPIYGTLSPVYVWMNVDNTTGGRVHIWAEDLWAGPPLVSDHVKENRDFYNAVSKDAQTSSSTPFNGATGMGFGAVARRPATCTTNSSEAGGGVGYWATDQGEWDAEHGGPDGQLYRCSATNTWTLHYQPYQYPHPLRGAEPAQTVAKPRAPIGLTVKPQ
jgi:hypothetical protein